MKTGETPYEVLLSGLEDDLRLSRTQQEFYRSADNEKNLIRWSKIASSIEQCINDVRLAFTRKGKGPNGEFRPTV